MLKLNKDEIIRLLEKRFENDLHKSLSTIPKPFIFKDMQKAAKRIVKAIKNNEKIAVVGDYDVDGIISSVIMNEFFVNIGANLEIKIPNRFSDGYGISENIVKDLDASLIITVDNGILAYDAANKCKDLGIDLIITDHHIPAENLPDAYAVINPKRSDCEFKKYSGCEICGAQVAWWLCGAIKQELQIEYNMASFLDLLCIAIMADMMSLNDINHILVKQGIKAINKTKRPAFIVLKEQFNKKFFDYESIPFLISPLLNASGRMDDAMISYNFLKANNKSEAYELLNIIMQLNSERKTEEKQSYEESKKFVDNKNIIVAYSKHWHKGILGIVAGKLAKKYNKCSFVFNIDDGIAKGSARSAGNIDILKLLDKVGDILDNYGGHKGAAGLSLKENKLDEFKNRLNEEHKKIKIDDFEFSSDILGELEFNEINMDLIDAINFYEPFGQGNEKPQFVSKNVIIKNPVLLKEKHLKCQFYQNSKIISGIFFNCENTYKDGDLVEITYYLQKNFFKNLQTIQLNILKINKKISDSEFMGYF